ncbi:MAG: hypothetical protein AAGI23_00765 [Bacteroidota bacterium]
MSKQEDLKTLSDEELEKKAKGAKTLIGIFVVLVLALTFFSVRDYLQGKTDWSILTITICTVGGLVVAWGQQKAVQKELERRKGV